MTIIDNNGQNCSECRFQAIIGFSIKKLPFFWSDWPKKEPFSKSPAVWLYFEKSTSKAALFQKKALFSKSPAVWLHFEKVDSKKGLFCSNPRGSITFFDPLFRLCTDYVFFWKKSISGLEIDNSDHKLTKSVVFSIYEQYYQLFR